MTDVTQILSQIEQGDPSAAEQLLPLVYDELRKLAAAKLANEKSGQTLQATALVHDAYVRLVDGKHSQRWQSRAHFFGAAAEAMRRILVDKARRKNRHKHGGDVRRIDIRLDDLPGGDQDRLLLDLDQALERFDQVDKTACKLVSLNFGMRRIEMKRSSDSGTRSAFSPISSVSYRTQCSASWSISRGTDSQCSKG